MIHAAPPRGVTRPTSRPIKPWKAKRAREGLVPVPMTPESTELSSKDLAEINRKIDELTFDERASSEAERAPSFGRIVVATDGSKPALWALQWGIALARAFDSKLWVACVGPPQRWVEKRTRRQSDWEEISKVFEEVNEDSQEVLEGAARRLRDARVKGLTQHLFGAPGRELLGFVESVRADLVILGAHGHGPLHRALLGSVTNSVKNHTRASVLIAKGPPRLKRLLAATDASGSGRAAARLAVRLAHPWKSQLLLLHVYTAAGFALPDEGRARFRNVIQGLDLPKADKRVEYRLEFGSPVKRICARAKAQDCGLIVVGNRGRGVARAYLLGSTSAGVAQAADTSVLVVKARRR